jgi:NAD(P)H-dependent FMN reductase
MHRKLDPKINLAVIYGSTREGRLCDKIARWTISQIEGDGPFAVEIVDPAELGSPARHPPKNDPALLALKERLALADGFIIVTPEYNRGYPAPLKMLIDSVGQEWRGKPVAFVSYGGFSGGLRAVEQLRLVFTELHATTIRDGVAFANVWDQFDSSGQVLNPDRAEKAMATMLAQLHWWATALRNARNLVSYGQFAL